MSYADVWRAGEASQLMLGVSGHGAAGCADRCKRARRYVGEQEDIREKVLREAAAAGRLGLAEVPRMLGLSLVVEHEGDLGRVVEDPRFIDELKQAWGLLPKWELIGDEDGVREELVALPEASVRAHLDWRMWRLLGDLVRLGALHPGHPTWVALDSEWDVGYEDHGSVEWLDGVLGDEAQVCVEGARHDDLDANQDKLRREPGQRRGPAQVDPARWPGRGD